MPDFRDILILAITSHGGDKAQEALRAGANRALSRPVENHLLIDAVFDLLKQVVKVTSMDDAFEEKSGSAADLQLKDLVINTLPTLKEDQRLAHEIKAKTYRSRLGTGPEIVNGRGIALNLCFGGRRGSVTKRLVIGGRRIDISNLDKVLYAGGGYTKPGIATAYESQSFSFPI